MKPRVPRIHGAPLRIRTVQELKRREARILEHIHGLRHGGLLFSLDPLRLLAEIGVELDRKVLAVIVAANPDVRRCGGPAYDILMRTTREQPMKVTLRGLFRLNETCRHG